MTEYNLLTKYRTVSTANEDENMDFRDKKTVTMATQTVGIVKTIVAAQKETMVVRNTILAERSNGSSGSSSSNCNRMSIKVIHDARQNCKYYSGLYPELFDALITFRKRGHH